MLRSTVRVRGRLVCPRLPLAVAVFLPREPFARAETDVPATPCACLRCAPSAAALVKTRPHSGHVNVESVRAVLLTGEADPLFERERFAVVDVLVALVARPVLVFARVFALRAFGDMSSP